MDIKRAYRFRFYPTDEQKVMLTQTFGCVRFVYNYMLRLRTDAWYKEKKTCGLSRHLLCFDGFEKRD